jgi:hypothetical protein
MTPWTALLESLHSALIDELTERHPEPKPTLGMPIRQAKLSLPPSAQAVLICEFSFDEARGFAMLAFEDGFMQALNILPEDLWQAILKRAGSEFMHRQIRPKTGQIQTFTDLKGYIDPGRVVWIPFQIPAGTCYLGLGV